MATTFYPAEGYHQDYYKKNPLRYNYYRNGCGRDARLKELWGDHAGKLFPRYGVYQAGGHGDRRILRIAAGGERVRLRVVHNIDLRHGQPGIGGDGLIECGCG